MAASDMIRPPRADDRHLLRSLFLSMWFSTGAEALPTIPQDLNVKRVIAFYIFVLGSQPDLQNLEKQCDHSRQRVPETGVRLPLRPRVCRFAGDI